MLTVLVHCFCYLCASVTLAAEMETKLAVPKSSCLETRNGSSCAFSLTCVYKTPAKKQSISWCVTQLIVKLCCWWYRLLRKQVQPQPTLTAQ